MLATQFLAAAEAAHNSHACDELARLTWRAHSEGHLDDATADGVAAALQARRSAFATGRAASPPRPATSRPRAARRPPRSPDRQASLERRRRQAASGALPPALAAQFTPGEQAVLAVVARQFRERQVCVLPIDAIAALAGVCRTVAKHAIRLARQLGLIEVRERRRPGWPSLTNIVRVVSKEWLGWLRLGAGGVGVGKTTATNTDSSLRGAKPQNSGHMRRRPEGLRGRAGPLGA